MLEEWQNQNFDNLYNTSEFSMNHVRSLSWGPWKSCFLQWLTIATANCMFSPALRTSLLDVKPQAVISCTDDLIVLADLLAHFNFLFLCFGSGFLGDFSPSLVPARALLVFLVVFFVCLRLNLTSQQLILLWWWSMYSPHSAVIIHLFKEPH